MGLRRSAVTGLVWACVPLHVVAACVGNDAAPSIGPSSVDAGDHPDAAGNVGNVGNVGEDSGNPTSDAGSHDDGSAPTFCTGKADAFCADFDRGGTVGESFDAVFERSGSIITSSNADFFSSPRSAFVSLKATEQGAGAGLHKTVQTGGKRHVRFHWAWRLREYTLSAGEALSYVGIAENGNADVSIIHGKQTSWFVNIDSKKAGADGGAAPFSMPSSTKWFSVVLDVVFSNTGTGSVSLSFDDVVVVAKTGLTTSGEDATSTVVLTLAATSIGATSPLIETFFDDVRVEVP